MICTLKYVYRSGSGAESETLINPRILQKSFRPAQLVLRQNHYF